MCIVPQTSLILLANAITTKAATNEPTGLVVVDLVFPRDETYSPTGFLPIVFAFQNPELAPLLGASLDYALWYWNNMFNALVMAGAYSMKYR